MDIDFNIDNYNLNDILNLFQVGHDFNEVDLKKSKKKVLMLHPDKSGLKKEYFLFFSKAYKILYQMYEFKKKSTKQYSDDYKDHVEDSKTLPNFNKMFKSANDFSSWFNKTFDEVNGYNDIVMLKNISLHSHCEHHMVPIIGKVHLAYLPVDKVVGISKLARVVDIFAKRLQTQETMTQQIAEVIQRCLKPKGVAIYIEAFHQCMTTRGVSKPNVSTITSCFLGEFKNNDKMENKFLNFVKE